MNLQAKLAKILFVYCGVYCGNSYIDFNQILHSDKDYQIPSWVVRTHVQQIPHILELQLTKFYAIYHIT